MTEPCEQRCGAEATVYAMGRGAGAWGGRYCEPCAHALDFQITDRLTRKGPHMKLTVTTGVDAAERYPNEIPPLVAKSLTVNLPDIDITPDEVFEAANVVLPFEEEHTRLQTPWQLVVRKLLTTNGMSSMSVGDRFTLEGSSEAGELTLTWVCERVGWTLLPRELVAA